VRLASLLVLPTPSDIPGKITDISRAPKSFPPLQRTRYPLFTQLKSTKKLKHKGGRLEEARKNTFTTTTSKTQTNCKSNLALDPPRLPLKKKTRRACVRPSCDGGIFRVLRASHLQRGRQAAKTSGGEVGAAEDEEQETPFFRRRHFAQTRQKVAERLRVNKSGRAGWGYTD